MRIARLSIVVILAVGLPLAAPTPSAGQPDPAAHHDATQAIAAVLRAAVEQIAAEQAERRAARERAAAERAALQAARERAAAEQQAAADRAAAEEAARRAAGEQAAAEETARRAAAEQAAAEETARRAAAEQAAADEAARRAAAEEAARRAATDRAAAERPAAEQPAANRGRPDAAAQWRRAGGQVRVGASRNAPPPAIAGGLALLLAAGLETGRRVRVRRRLERTGAALAISPSFDPAAGEASGDSIDADAPEVRLRATLALGEARFEGGEPEREMADG